MASSSYQIHCLAIEKWSNFFVYPHLALITLSSIVLISFCDVTRSISVQWSIIFHLHLVCTMRKSANTKHRACGDQSMCFSNSNYACIIREFNGITWLTVYFDWLCFEKAVHKITNLVFLNDFYRECAYTCDQKLKYHYFLPFVLSCLFSDYGEE